MFNLTESVNEVLDSRPITKSTCCNATLLGRDEDGGDLILCKNCKSVQGFVYVCDSCKLVMKIVAVSGDNWKKDIDGAKAGHLCN